MNAQGKKFSDKWLSSPEFGAFIYRDPPQFTPLIAQTVNFVNKTYCESDLVLSR